MISGMTLLFSVTLIAGLIGDVTNAGTSTGQRQRKRDKLGGTISPLADDNGKYALSSFSTGSKIFIIQATVSTQFSHS